jgi:4-hydroxybenzoate polyprenyltransferase
VHPPDWSAADSEELAVLRRSLLYNVAMANAALRDATDIRRGDWVDRLVPASLRPYCRLARLDRPIGTWLLLFPGWWAIAMAGEAWPDGRLIALFGLGALAMRGAGCTLNDIADREFDARVARTRTRPIPSGAVSVKQAIVFMALLLAIGAAILFSLGRVAILLGIAVLALIATYPFMKRITYWPQFFLGLNFNWGALLGWAAATGTVETPALLLYLGGIAWTLGYDTIYAHQDKEDDVLIGVKSSALALGERTRPFLYLAYLAAAALWAASGLAAALAWPFFLALALAALQLLWQARRVRLDDPADCLAKFRSNRLVGWLLLLGAVAARLV